MRNTEVRSTLLYSMKSLDARPGGSLWVPSFGGFLVDRQVVLETDLHGYVKLRQSSHSYSSNETSSTRVYIGNNEDSVAKTVFIGSYLQDLLTLQYPTLEQPW